MPIDIPRLRYWFAAAAIVTIVVVAAFYFYARRAALGAVAELPKRIPSGVQQSTHGFSLSKSEGGHTLFTLRAKRTVQYDEGGRAQLKDVRIVVYGRESNRFDQIYGDDFVYDPRSGDVVANGIVHIDLQGGNGVPHPDQAPPQELKNPIHLITSALVFNQKTGDASTRERVDFRLAQASGWAIGAHYDSQHNQLALDKDIHIITSDPDPANITAARGFMTKEPHRAILYDAHISRQDSTVITAQLTLFLRADDSIEHITGAGGVDSTTTGPTTLHVHSPEAALYLNSRGNAIEFADMMGGATFDASGLNTMSGSADNVHTEFAAQSQVRKIHAQGNVRLIQPPKPGSSSSSLAGGPGGQAQKIELDADAIDFWLSGGNQLRRAETSQNARIIMTPQDSSVLPRQETGPPRDHQGERTVITAAKFYAGFKGNRLETLTGVPNAQVISSASGRADRVSTSRAIEFGFSPTGDVSQIKQHDNFRYREHLPNGSDRDGWAQSAIYSQATDTLTLLGHPRVVEGGMTTTARMVRLHRQTGYAEAEDNVKTTYSDVKPQLPQPGPGHSGGALLASGEPIHVTAHSMVAQLSTGMAHYAGHARLWQGANIIAAPNIDFDRNDGTLVAVDMAWLASHPSEPSAGASGGAPNPPAPSTRSGSVVGVSGQKQRVTTVLTQQEKDGKQAPVNVTSDRLTYWDGHRLAKFEGGVVVQSVDGTLTANKVNVYLKPVLLGSHPNTPATGALGSDAPGPSSVWTFQGGQLDKMIADGKVVLQQPDRRTTGEQLVYTDALDEYVMTGGPPRMYDAQHGNVTGTSLTFYNHDDRVLVEGGGNSRAVTHTRVPK